MSSLEKILTDLEYFVVRSLEGGENDAETIRNEITCFAHMPRYKGLISDEHILIISKRVEARLDISMDIGSWLEAENYTPWLDYSRSEIDWHYWSNYKRLLSEKGFNAKVIASLDIVTDKIIDHLEDPKKEGGWLRKGLVVGHVQSGKTANYTGVISKAADSGYKVIIILAGLLNALRNQTQKRIDEGFIGIDSSLQLENITLQQKRIGVGKYNGTKHPVSLTTSSSDFDKKIATQLNAQIDDFNKPVVIVLKKNVSILKNLIDWFKSNNLRLSKVPMLLIDDEADHASVNTSKEDEDPTATNRRIRELLSLFNQRCYLGYTATPFANIFINPETDDEMLEDDLFPEDFIISLDAPSNYVGAKRIFGEGSDLDILREVDDYEDILPLKHKKDEFPDILPASLKEAIRSFILIKACRNLRNQRKKHNSMLINISRFTDIQSHIKILVHEYLIELRESISNSYKLTEEDALNTSIITSLKTTWDKEFIDAEFTWSDIQAELKKAAFSISVIEVNGSRDSEQLDYSNRTYPKGRNLIAIGGLSLSRGLTLEGLTVSYFLRNSIMYDTLMQMGRWFGYRTNFEDLCRIYMPEDAISWYTHISQVTEELRDEFKQMESIGMTPSQYGLSVRRHPESLIVTARNKMRTSKPVLVKIDLEGRLIETSVLSAKMTVIDNNWRAMTYLIEMIKNICIYQQFGNSHLFLKCPIEHIKSFFSSFINHPASPKTNEKPIIEYMNWLFENDIKYNTWDVLLLSKLDSESDLKKDVSGYACQAELRNIVKIEGNAIAGNKRRFGSDPDQRAGIEEADLEKLLSKYKTISKIPAKEYRKNRNLPLLIFHILDCRLKGEKVSTKGIISYEISFPGESNTARPKKLVEYEANTTYWRQYYGEIEDE